MNPWLISIPIAYLLGSIPFGYLLVRVFRNEDIRATGSGNIGATNVVRSGAVGLGVATFLLDVCKAFAAVLLAQRLAPGNIDLAVASAVAAILGHCFPVWLRFRGGKGVASALGVMLALDWRVGLGIFAVFLVLVLMTRYVSLGSVAGAALFPIALLYRTPERTPIVVSGAIFIGLLIIWKHRENLGRLIAGTENRMGSRKEADKA